METIYFPLKHPLRKNTKSKSQILKTQRTTHMNLIFQFRFIHSPYTYSHPGHTISFVYTTDVPGSFKSPHCAQCAFGAHSRHYSIDRVTSHSVEYLHWSEFGERWTKKGYIAINVYCWWCCGGRRVDGRSGYGNCLPTRCTSSHIIGASSGRLYNREWCARRPKCQCVSCGVENITNVCGVFESFLP